MHRRYLHYEPTRGGREPPTCYVAIDKGKRKTVLAVHVEQGGCVKDLTIDASAIAAALREMGWYVCELL